MGKYYDVPSVMQVIGGVYLNPHFMDMTEKYTFNEEDFSGEEFHRVLFGAIYNLHQLGATEITPTTIETYLEQRPKKLAVYQTNKGTEYLQKLIENTQVAAFDYYYNRVKKMTLLRMYSSIGMDVSWLYDTDNILDVKKKQAQEEWLDNHTPDEIADTIDNKITNIRLKYVDNTDDEFIQAGKGINELLERLEQHPELGYPLFDSYMNTVTRGARLKKFYLRSAATGVGKALPNSTLIPTPSGFKTVKEIKEGDYLFDAFGKPTRVMRVFPQGEKEVWEVVFKDGRRAKCCNEHLWSFCTEGQRKEQKIGRKFYTKTLEEISKMPLYKNGHGYQVLVPMQKAVEYSEKEYFIKPYSFGLLLGDGSFRYDRTQKGLSFSSENNILPSKIAEEMNWNYKRSSEKNYDWVFEYRNENSHKNVWVEEALKDYPALWNVKSEDKFIPIEYLQGSISQRFDLLNGLLDSDGSVDKEKGRIFYYTISKKLRDDFVFLCQSLGFKASWAEDTHKETNVCYKIEIMGTPEDKIKLFKLQRKKDLILNWFNNGKKKENNLFNPIIEINNLHYKEDMTCFLVDNDEHLFLMNDYIVTHNTRSMIADTCFIGCDQIWDEYENKWVNNGTCEPVLFITTEQEEDEIQTMMLAFLSAVDEEHILTGSYDEGEKERVLKAARLLERSEIHIKKLPDFSLQDVENCIKYGIREWDARYVFFDYMHSSMKILSEIGSRSGVKGLREDNVLFLMSVKLKDICNEYGVFIMSATQLNAGYTDAEVYDQNLLRGRPLG